MFLFDTDTLSQVMKTNPSSNLLNRLAAAPPEQQFTSSITVGELVYGAHHGPRTEHHLRQLDEIVLPMVHVLPFDRAAAEVYGSIRADLERAGTPLSEPDLRIGSIALTNNLTVVTGNVRHFDRIPGLQVENWI
jgi:predicted nucleic acid-binding protein